MISPTRPSEPTRTTSYIFASTNPSAMTTGPETRATDPAMFLPSVGSLARDRERDAQDALRESLDALHLELARRGRHEDDQGVERGIGGGPLGVREQSADRLRRDDERVPAAHRALELDDRVVRRDLDDVLEADQAEPDGELALSDHDGAPCLFRRLGHGSVGGVPAYLTPTGAALTVTRTFRPNGLRATRRTAVRSGGHLARQQEGGRYRHGRGGGQQFREPPLARLGTRRAHHPEGRPLAVPPISGPKVPVGS